MTVLEARDRLGGRTWTDDSLGAPLDLGGSWVHGVDGGNPLTLWCDKLGVELVESQGDRLLIDKRATAPTREGQRKRAVLGRAAFKTAIEWASWKSKAMTVVKGPALDLGEAGGRSAAACVVAAGNRQARDRDLRGDERRRAGRALRCDRGRGMVSERGLERNAQPKGGFRPLLEDAARASTCVQRAGRARRLNDARRPAILKGGETIEADRAVDQCRSACCAGCRLDPLPPIEQQQAIGRLGYGAGVLGKIYLRFPRRFWPEHPKWFGRLPDAPDRRGTFNTWVSHLGETGLPILLSFSNGATAARLDRSASDAEVKDVAMASLRKMFDDVPEPEAMLFPRWLSDPWSHGGYPIRACGSTRKTVRSCPAAREPRVLCRRGDRAGRIWHGARRPVVGRADRRGDLQAAAGQAGEMPRELRGRGPAR